MLKLNYFIHLILNSRYKLFINLFILLTIYIVLYGNNTVFCMNDNSNLGSVPEIAEAKETIRPSQQLLAIKREIMTYAGSNAYLFDRIEEQTKLIEEQKDLITSLNQRIERLDTQNYNLQRDLNISKLHDLERSEYSSLKYRLLDETKVVKSDISSLKHHLKYMEECVDRMFAAEKKSENYLRIQRDSFWEEHHKKFSRRSF